MNVVTETPKKKRETSPWAVLAITLSAVFMQLLDTTITMVGVPSIQADLGASYGQIQLVVAGYTLAFASVLVLGGRLGDTYGRRRMFLAGMLGFTLASALCGAAPDAITLIAARVLQGLTSGLMFPQVLGILQVMFGPAQRAKALAMYGATVGLATVLGPVTGGALIDADLFGSGWRSIFYINLPVGILALALGLRMIPESRAAKASRLDVRGAVLLTAGLFLLVMPMVVGRDQGWPAWAWICMAVSPLVLAVFVRAERRHSAPLVDLKLFRQKPFTLGLAASLVFFTGIPSFFMILVILLQTGLGYSPVKAGTVTLGFALAMAVGSARSAAVAQKLGTRILVLGAALMLVGQAAVMAVLYGTGTSLSGWHLVVPMFVAGLGGGLFLAPLTHVVLAGIRSDDAGSASGVLATAQQVGAALGVAVVGVVFFGLIGANAAGSSAAATPQLRASLVAAGLPTEAQDRVVEGFETCFDDQAHAEDPAETPESCKAVAAEVAASPAAPEVKAKVAAAVQDVAVPHARLDDFNRSMRGSLWWHLAVFATALALVSRLPKVELAEGHGAGAA
ncbi:DHA2 family efflux MFS transporter permease subunit [Actinocorallia longicatena]|uniref:MFS transporter n=1 Tax=Actinocorallia longicatena TaxID=111803 RepID=A0ABP6Q9K3_9ACTN